MQTKYLVNTQVSHWQ